MKQIQAKILLNKEIASSHFKMVLNLGKLNVPIKPGQFLHIKAGSDYDPLLRRPISIHRIGSNPNIIELLYKIKGKGTQLMSRRSKGAYLDVIGPLGNGFKVPKGQSNFILIAGGMGIAPLVALADNLARFRKRTITVILGARTKDFIICKRELRDIGAKVIVVTEDGSEGKKGLVTAVLESVIEQFDLRKSATALTKKHTKGITIAEYGPEVGLYVCGPSGMLKAVAAIARHYTIQAQASFEERMGCGVGACLGCVVQTKAGYKRVCKDGPVFDLEEIVWG